MPLTLRVRNLTLPLVLVLATTTLAAQIGNDSNGGNTTAAPYPTSDAANYDDATPAVRVQQLKLNEAASSNQSYDVIDVLASTNAVVGKSKTGQTTRIYTTGDVNDDFWLKHLGEDFKHAIHLQVGGTNDEYNRLINQTKDGVHEEVHHEYLPGAERPRDGADSAHHDDAASNTRAYERRPFVSHLSIDGEGLNLKHNYLQQRQENAPTTQQHTATQHTATQNAHTYARNRNHKYSKAARYPHKYNSKTRTYVRKQIHAHTHTNTHTQQHPHPHTSPGIINSSEDTAPPTSRLHNADAAADAAAAASASYDSSAHSQLPFKSPFNDYGNRPTRDLTHELYQRGL